jgi:hypothetical protein
VFIVIQKPNSNKVFFFFFFLREFNDNFCTSSFEFSNYLYKKSKVKVGDHTEIKDRKYYYFNLCDWMDYILSIHCTKSG